MLLQSATCLFLSIAVRGNQLRFLWTIGSSKESRAILCKFGVNARAIPTVPHVAIEHINEYFTTCESDSCQQSTVRKTSSDWAWWAAGTISLLLTRRTGPRHLTCCQQEQTKMGFWLAARGAMATWTCPDSAVQRVRMWTITLPAECPCHSA